MRKNKKSEWRFDELAILSMSAVLSSFFATKTWLTKDETFLFFVVEVLSGTLIFGCILGLCWFAVGEFIRSKSSDEIKTYMVVIVFLASVFAGSIGYSMFGNKNEYVLKSEYDELLNEYEEYRENAEYRIAEAEDDW